MATGTREIHLEEHIVNFLTKNALPFPDFQLKENKDYDQTLCLIPEDTIAFVKATQPNKYNELYKQYGTQTDRKIVERLAESVNKFKTLHIFREGIKDRGQLLHLIYFQPTHSKTPEHVRWYAENRLSIIRQLRFSAHSQQSVDIVFFINGLPVLTIELKNALTGQYLQEAIKQYIRDRNPKEPLFEFKRCLVHFACSTELTAMTTELRGKSTVFLPFNKDLINKDPNDYATSYLWKDVLRKDSLLDLIQNYVNIQISYDKYFDPTSQKLKEKERTLLIFPRFHQRRAVTKLVDAVREQGVGNKYLIQHSAGSGKSNTISWLAHRLADFFQHPNDENALFNSVIVVTDRRVLNTQIQNSIRQFEQAPGTVEYIDNNKSSQDLRIAIEQGKRIIVTTLQKFPVISEVIVQQKNKRFAVIIDEAHSSQSGESARHLRKSLSLEDAGNEEEEIDLDDLIEQEIRKKGDQQNISFFAFTATPKPKTLELFGTLQNGIKEPFDVYTMEQAIKEGFIKDVLKNYVSWKRYYKLVKRNEDLDKEYDKKQAVRLLSNYVDLQTHAIEKKTRVMLEHFVTQTQREIQGKARAMLVTRSRLHAVRYKRKFDEIISEMKLPFEALVAFSGTVMDTETGEDYTKESMNRLGGRIDIPDALKLPQYRILIVANMYQTGFDEPLLQTMFVDKKLGGANAVQTISRLNRTMSGKDSTIVLDFVNEPEMIQADFQNYYGSNFMEADQQTDPNGLYDLQREIDAFHLFSLQELRDFANWFFNKGDHKERLQPILNLVTERFVSTLDESEQQVYKMKIRTFVRAYRFLSQIITFSDIELEKYYVFLSDLYKKLPQVRINHPIEVLDEVDLYSYKLQYQFTSNMSLESGNTAVTGLKIGTEGVSKEEETEWLSRILKVLNDIYGVELKDEDKVEFEKMRVNIFENDDLMGFFNKRNSKENIQDKFNEEIDNELLNFINNKLELYNKLSEDRVNLMFKSLWFNELYDQKVRGINRH